MPLGGADGEGGGRRDRCGGRGRHGRGRSRRRGHDGSGHRARRESPATTLPEAAAEDRRAAASEELPAPVRRAPRVAPPERAPRALRERALRARVRAAPEGRDSAAGAAASAVAASAPRARIARMARAPPIRARCGRSFACARRSRRPDRAAIRGTWPWGRAARRSRSAMRVLARQRRGFGDVGLTNTFTPNWNESITPGTRFSAGLLSSQANPGRFASRDDDPPAGAEPICSVSPVLDAAAFASGSATFSAGSCTTLEIGLDCVSP